MTFVIVEKNNIKNYTEFIQYIIGKNKIINYTIYNIMNIFLLISFIVMVSGFGTYFTQEFNISVFFGSILICFLALITFYKGIYGIIKINSILIPCIIFLITLLGIKEKVFLFKLNDLNIYTNRSWIMQALLYACYNSIILIPIVIDLGKLVNNKKQSIFIVFITVTCMLVMSIIIYIILSININEIKHIDIPIIYIAKNFGITYKYIYGLVILTAIFTTAISAGYSFLSNITKNSKKFFIFSIFLCLISIICSSFGFSVLLGFLYPILGFLGLFQVILLIIRYFINY